MAKNEKVVLAYSGGLDTGDPALAQGDLWI